ncbi:MAG: PHP domain-containing protein [Desulfobacteraceae bacterium]
MSLNDRVTFARPDLLHLTKDHTVVDLHFHSHYSDGMNRIPKIAERAKSLGIGIAVTDHNEIRGAIEIDADEEVFTIPGIEITSAEGSHLLIYFYETKDLETFYIQHVEPFMGPDVMSSLQLTMEQVIRRARTFDCVIIFAHPYCAMYTGVCNVQFSLEDRERLFDQVDGVEAINASNLNKWNLKCAVLGFNLNKAMAGGSDGHSIGHMGRAVTYARSVPDRKAFLDAVKMQETRVIGKEMHFLRKMTSNGLKLRSNIHNCPDLMEKHLRYSCKVINFKSRSIRSRVRRRFSQRFNSSTLRSYLGI